MADTIIIRYSDTPAATPTLTLGEIAINRADGKLFWLNSSNALQSMFLGNAIAAVLTGFSAGSGTVAATDTILQAINKIVGNQALKAPLASPTFTGTVVLPSTTSIGTITNTELSYVDGVTSAIQTQLDAKAALASPTFTGTPALPTGTTAVTQSAADSTTKLATTAFVTTADNLKANLASPTFTGTPLSTTAAADTNTTQIATTAFVIGQAYAKLASPTFTGTPAAPTAAANTNTTQLATTAFVNAEAKKEVIAIACSDLTTALTTGTNKAYFRMPWAGTLTAVKASVLTAPTGSTIIVDINEAGTTVMTTTKLSIDASEKTSATAASAAAITDSALADDAEITIDIDQIGSTIAGAGLVVYLYITRT